MRSWHVRGSLQSVLRPDCLILWGSTGTYGLIYVVKGGTGRAHAQPKPHVRSAHVTRSRARVDSVQQVPGKYQWPGYAPACGLIYVEGLHTQFVHVDLCTVEYSDMDTLEPQNYDLSEVSILFLCPVYRKVMCYFSGISWVEFHCTMDIYYWYEGWTSVDVCTEFLSPFLSYLGSTLRQMEIEPMPSLSDVRRVITEHCILPLGEHVKTHHLNWYRQ